MAEQRFEHHAYVLDEFDRGSAGAVEKAVQGMEKAGWELCGIETYATRTSYWFKRPVDTSIFACKDGCFIECDNPEHPHL